MSFAVSGGMQHRWHALALTFLLLACGEPSTPSPQAVLPPSSPSTSPSERDEEPGRDGGMPAQPAPEWHAKLPERYVVQICGLGVPVDCSRFAVAEGRVLGTQWRLLAGEGDGWGALRVRDIQEPLLVLAGAANDASCGTPEVTLDPEWGYVSRVLSDCLSREVVCFKPNTVDLTACDVVPENSHDIFCPRSKTPFRVLEATVEGPLLTLDIEYAGGCKAHAFAAGWTGLASASGAVAIEVQHYEHGDVCEQQISETLHLDLSPLRRLGDRVELEVRLSDTDVVARVVYSADGPDLDMPDDTLALKRECAYLTP